MKYNLDTGQHLITKQFRILQMKVDVLSKRKGYRRIAVTSAIAGEGKTLVSTNLAAQMASNGKRVLLIDADVRKSKVAGRLDVKGSPGIAEYLLGRVKAAEVVQISKTRGLHVIAGGNPDISVDLPTSDKFNELLESVEKSYDCVVIDTPPIIPVADMLYIKNFVDGILFIFRMAYTPHHLFAKAIEDIGRDKLIGVVLNSVNFDKIAHNKYYDYGYKPQKQDVDDAAALAAGELRVAGSAMPSSRRDVVAD